MYIKDYSAFIAKQNRILRPIKEVPGVVLILCIYIYICINTYIYAYIHKPVHTQEVSCPSVPQLSSNFYGILSLHAPRI
jgi:hypothetical protein